LHAYTLVHDDLPCMDDDDVRRGKPTVHKAFGEAEAVLAGDALQALAFRMVCELPERCQGRALRCLADAAGPSGVIGGQWEDVAGQVVPLNRHSSLVVRHANDEKRMTKNDASKIAYVHHHKTADVLECAARLGGVCGGGSEAQCEALGRYGHHVGMAFQIVDDLLDESERQKKPSEERELSCLDVWSSEQARHEARRHSHEALGALDGLPGDTAPLRGLARFLLERGI
ncbi:MAG: polyprenyl synthetase family protein, partial [Kiritimatiellaeota bacterium]|nr:polyprenyl synthetase family protein [Kiritimatiellota bacterium]